MVNVPWRTRRPPSQSTTARRQAREDRHQRPEDPAQPGRHRFFRMYSSPQGCEPGLAVRLLGVGLDDPDPSQVFLDEDAEAARGTAGPPGTPMDAITETQDQRGDPGSEMSDHRVSQGSMWLIRGRAARISTMPSRAATGADAQHLADGGEVVGQAGHQLARLHPLEIGQRQPLEMREELIAKIPLDVAGESEDVDAPEIPERPPARKPRRR